MTALTSWQALPLAGGLVLVGVALLAIWVILNYE